MNTAPFSWLTEICGQLTAAASVMKPEAKATEHNKTIIDKPANLYRDILTKLPNILPAKETSHVLKEMWNQNLERNHPRPRTDRKADRFSISL
jgi:hypothetical protein